ncbi:MULTISPECIES: O-methyltransferase [Bacillus]|uniref:O-methyltransferase n=1 Tax=Bacillus TaxID=1386 RepID=UPI001D0D285D|nr:MULTISPECIES: O-methyltransferase [Bacillus]
MDEKIISYLESLINEREPLLNKMEQLAKEEQVPIMDLVGMETLLQLLRIQQPKKILEIGTAIGYSAIRMAKTIENAEIVTIERDEKRYGQAEQFAKEAKLEDRLHFIFGDATETHELIEKMAPYDVIFVDAAKGQYERFFTMYEKYLAPTGIIVTDNVLFKGLVAENIEEIEPKRIKNLVKKIDKFNRWLMENEKYDTAILPVGDGIAISKLKR